MTKLAEVYRPEADRPAVGGAFVWHRDWPAEWERQLRAVSPKSDEHGWLHGVWEPGEEWVPGQRWVLYEMVHPRWVPFEVLEEYDGPNPRTEGHYCSDKVPKQFQCLCRKKSESWRGGPCSLCYQTQTACTCAAFTPYIITLTQWRLYRATGYVPLHLFWIIQGKGGGHKAFLTEQEEDWLAATGKELHVPALGELPYAEFDGRVLAHIHRLNALKRYGNDLMKYRRAMGRDYPEEVQKRLREFRESVIHWLDTQMNEEMDLFVRAADEGEMDDLPKTDVDYERLYDATVPQYIETGDLVHPWELA